MQLGRGPQVDVHPARPGGTVSAAAASSSPPAPPGPGRARARGGTAAMVRGRLACGWSRRARHLAGWYGYHRLAHHFSAWLTVLAEVHSFVDQLHSLAGTPDRCRSHPVHPAGDRRSPSPIADSDSGSRCSASPVDPAVACAAGRGLDGDPRSAFRRAADGHLDAGEGASVAQSVAKAGSADTRAGRLGRGDVQGPSRCWLSQHLFRREAWWWTGVFLDAIVARPGLEGHRRDEEVSCRRDTQSSLRK